MKSEHSLVTLLHLTFIGALIQTACTQSDGKVSETAWTSQDADEAAASSRAVGVGRAVVGGTVSAREWENFQLTNDKRAQGFSCPQGSSYPPNPEPLVFDCRLWKASQLHSADMGAQRYFDHSSLDGRSPWDRAQAQGISANGENIAAGSSGAAATLEQWLNSDGHCRNLGKAGFKMFGVGYAEASGSPYRHYWTEMFKSDVVAADTSCYPEDSSSGSGVEKTLKLARLLPIVAAGAAVVAVAAVLFFLWRRGKLPKLKLPNLKLPTASSSTPQAAPAAAPQAAPAAVRAQGGNVADRIGQFENKAAVRV